MPANTTTTEHELFREWDLYDRIGLANYMKQREIGASIRTALERRPGPLRVLDLGCGDGRVSREILAGSDVREFAGVDLSGSAIGRHEGRMPPGTRPDEVRRTLLCGDIEAELETMPDGAFDLVHASYSLHHFPAEAKRRVLGQIARVLDRGGWFIWTDILRGKDETRDAAVARMGAEIGEHWTDLSPDERRSVAEHVRECDFPEPVSWMIVEAGARGMSHSETLFRDPHYNSDMFTKR